MGKARVSVNGRNYALVCADGQEARLEELAEFVSDRLATLKSQFGAGADDQLTVMALLLLADELLDARDRVDALEKLLPTKELSKLAKLAGKSANRVKKKRRDAEQVDALDELEADLPLSDELPKVVQRLAFSV